MSNIRIHVLATTRKSHQDFKRSRNASNLSLKNTLQRRSVLYSCLCIYECMHQTKKLTLIIFIFRCRFEIPKSPKLVSMGTVEVIIQISKEQLQQQPQKPSIKAGWTDTDQDLPDFMCIKKPVGLRPFLLVLYKKCVCV